MNADILKALGTVAARLEATHETVTEIKQLLGDFRTFEKFKQVAQDIAPTLSAGPGTCRRR